MISAQAKIRLGNPSAVLTALRDHMVEHDIDIHDVEDVVVAHIRAGEARLHAGDIELSLEARAPSQSQLENLASFLASHVLEFAHPEKPGIEWSGLQAGARFSDFREMVVTRVEDLTPQMRRISLKGEDLDRFDTGEDLHVRLFFPPPGQEPLWPVRGADGLVQPAPEERKPAVRKYTIRRINTDAGTLDIDFVIHEAAGPGSDWAKGAAPGMRIGMAGPGGRSAKQADWMLLAGDETALPAIARILEGLPVTAAGIVVLVADKTADAIALRHPPGFRVERLDRRSGSADFTSTVLAIDIPRDRTRFCWAGAEFDEIQAIRRHWRDTVGLSSGEQLAVAYWREGKADS
ncbi:siderophore-interacting protein [Mesorhizobium sp. 8]|uniref:siderophore-interacting protein n=1 Tax=Mesorhizobium sp. 8 TaxID=2584466 RepID=UPI001120C84B|nr:siderophore-interacting protein [Mesorhizobium sp. 8]QDC00762.1 siderophore-interacting protein [Mesorhizobium sp. 8]